MSIIARLISVVFHPLFVYWYTVVAILLLNPYVFGYSDISEAKDLLFQIFISVVPIPIVGVVMLRALGWAQSIELKKKEERVGPFIITGIIYLSMYVPLTKSGAALPLQIVGLAAVIAIFTSFFINNFIKISIHAVAMGVLTSTVALMIVYFSGGPAEINIGSREILLETTTFLYLALIVSGIVCTSRLVLKAHSVSEIYLGYLVGFFTPLIATLIEQ